MSVWQLGRATLQPTFRSQGLVKRSYWFGSGPSPSKRVVADVRMPLGWGMDGAWEPMIIAALV